ncbi:methyltransferase domain-containing protein [Zooshikella marina]|uniref:class I SAM-dependent methyltransferase n=1 Tax=Zooshikella ganghwensis TaxID=202772 RepID=UPI001BAF80AF|nr:class I SAM-dependent methyltransferase [Zooshikella ganghwensis]MBU2707470.1 methyltransferase domain-containing protein [Zooshikella ganghwensis]
MFILGLIIGVVLTWLVMSGMAGLFISVCRGSINEQRVNGEFFTPEQWLLNTSSAPLFTWCNFGYWRNVNNYVQACMNLAGLVADEVQLVPKDHLFDAGFRSPDQLLVWADLYQVDAIKACGLNIWRLQLARERCQAYPQVELLSGNHMQLTQQEDKSIDKIVALDCIYFFSDKQAFFDNASRVLQPKGLIGITDILLTQPFNVPWQAWLFNRFLAICKIPEENIIPEAVYKQKLDKAGFRLISCKDITTDVLGGFCDWVQQQTNTLKASIAMNVRLRLKILEWILRWLIQNNIIQYVIIAAELKAADGEQDEDKVNNIVTEIVTEDDA